MSYTISINGQQAVDAGYKFCEGNCYRSLEGIGQLEVVIDLEGEFHGRPNKWVDVSYIEESNVPKVLHKLEELGFSGCEAVIIEETIEGSFCKQKELYSLIIGEESVNEPNQGSKFTISIGTGLAWTEQFVVYAANEQEAVDLVADYIEEHEMCGLYTTHQDISDEELGNSGYNTVDEYAEANGLVCCGNHGIYIAIIDIEEVRK